MPDANKVRENCLNQRVKKNKIKKFVPIVACLAIAAVAAAAGISQLDRPAVIENPEQLTTAPAVETTAAHTPEALNFNEASNMLGLFRYIKGHFWRELSGEETSALLESLSNFAVTATANFSSDADGAKLYNVTASIASDKAKVALTMAYGEVELDYVFDTQTTATTVNGVEVTAGRYTYEDVSTWFASFLKDGIAYYLEAQGGDEARQALESSVDSLTLAPACRLDTIETGDIPELIDETLTPQLAKADSSFGAYVPENIPPRYTLDTVSRFKNQASDYLYLRWSYGLSDITVNISSLTNEDEKRLTFAEYTVNYDLSLYPIPWAESVPEELWEIVQNPIFKIEELTPDIIKMRSYTVNDAGDSEGCKISLSVLYGDTVVQVNAKGAEPPEIYDMLMGIK